MIKKTNKAVSFIKVFILVFGMIFTAIGLSTFFITKAKISNMIEAEATVVYTDYYSENNSSTVIEYTVDDITYNTKINFSSSSLYPGAKINVYYSPDNYYDVVYAKGNYILSIVFTSIGSAFIIAFIVVLIVFSTKNSGNKKLIEKGYSVNAEFKEVKLNESISINNTHPYKIICEYDELGVKHTFKSENIWFDPTTIINEKNINYFRVYVDETNYKKYYMDLSEIKEEN